MLFVTNWWIITIIFRCRAHGIPFYIGVIVPFVVIYVFNWIVYSVILFTLICKNCHKDEQDRKARVTTKQQLIAAVTLSVLFGLGWGIGLAATEGINVSAVRDTFSALFIIFTAFQGVMVFCLQTLRSKDIRKTWARWFKTATGKDLSGFTSTASISQIWHNRRSANRSVTLNYQMSTFQKSDVEKALPSEIDTSIIITIEPQGPVVLVALPEDKNDATTSEQPVTMTANKDGTTSEQPVTMSANKDATTIEQPVTMNANKDATTSEQPLTMSANKDATTSEQPVTMTANKDGTTSEQPVTMTANKDGTTSEQPVTMSANKDATTSEQPVTMSANKDATTIEQPVTMTANKDGTTSEQPVTMSANKDATTSEQPVTMSANKDATTSEQPVTTSANKDTTTSEQPVTTSANKDEPVDAAADSPMSSTPIVVEQDESTEAKPNPNSGKGDPNDASSLTMKDQHNEDKQTENRDDQVDTDSIKSSTTEDKVVKDEPSGILPIEDDQRDSIHVKKDDPSSARPRLKLVTSDYQDDDTIVHCVRPSKLFNDTRHKIFTQDDKVTPKPQIGEQKETTEYTSLTDQAKVTVTGKDTETDSISTQDDKRTPNPQNDEQREESTNQAKITIAGEDKKADLIPLQDTQKPNDEETTELTSLTDQAKISAAGKGKETNLISLQDDIVRPKPQIGEQREEATDKEQIKVAGENMEADLIPSQDDKTTPTAHSDEQTTGDTCLQK